MLRARPAHLNDNVTEGSAVHTGADSRTELTFADLTITRIGSEQYFSFEENGRNVNVENGAILLRVPTDSGGARIRSSALTVGITGTTAMFEHHRRTYTKLIVLEGSSEAWLTKYPGKRVRVRGVPNARWRKLARHGCLNRSISTWIVCCEPRSLITQFPPLPSLNPIRNVANGQKKSGGPLDQSILSTRPG